MVPGEVWHVTITGSATVTVDYTVQPGDTKNDVVSAIAALIDDANGGTYATSVSGFVIAVDDTGSIIRPTISVAIDPTSSPDATATPGATGNGNVAYATLGGNVVTDEVWTLNLAGQSAATYTVVGTKTAEDVGAGLLAGINSSLYSASYNLTSKVLTIVRLDNAAISATKSIVMPISNPIATSTSVLHEDWVQTVGSLDAFVAGDEFTMTVTRETGATPATTVTYPVQAGDTVDSLLTGLTSGLSALGYTTSVSNGVLTISRSDRESVVVAIVHHSANLAKSTTDDTQTHYNAATLEISLKTSPTFVSQSSSTKVPRGRRWILTIEGTQFVYTTQKNDTLADVVSNLKTKAVAGGWTAAINTSNAAKLDLSALNGATVTLTEGDGTLTGLLDIDRFVDSVTGAARPETMYVRLLEGTTEIATINVAGTSADSGSLTTNDPLRTFAITHAGTYTIEVGSMSSDPTPVPQGVPAGTLYRLNVSLPGHAVNDNQVNLTDKTIAFHYTEDVAGVPTAKVFTTKIAGYDAESGTYTLQDTLNSNVKVGDTFEIVFDMAEAYPQYLNAEYKGYREDTYTVVLTQQPAVGETVTVTLNGIDTRTYNSKLAFEAGNGEHNVPQVTTNVTTLTFDSTDW
ncbi:MAG: hypothetical protein KDB01_17740, partial [Planctomycetaceae bacterium]|nr:hypothetical protein [Planctomycetaceae bacterium]